MADQVRECDWCHASLAAAVRSDAKTCSKRCRQARHRFIRAVVPAGAASSRISLVDGALQPRRIAYADPPYPGLARRYYRDHPDFRGEVDHRELIRRLSRFDGWALSTSVAALPAVLALCDDRGVRVAAWFRGARPTKSAHPLHAWEPVLYVPARSRLDERPRVDALVYVARPRTADPARVVGAKPATFARWLFELVAAVPGDTFEDLFPGSGGIVRAWRAFTARDPFATRRDRRPARQASR